MTRTEHDQIIGPSRCQKGDRGPLVFRLRLSLFDAPQALSFAIRPEHRYVCETDEVARTFEYWREPR